MQSSAYIDQESYGKINQDLFEQQISVNAALSYFGLTSKQFQEEVLPRLNAENQTKLRNLLRDVGSMIGTLKEKNQFTSYALINWGEIYLEAEELGEEHLALFHKRFRRLHSLAKKADYGMSMVYLGLNLFGLLLTLGASVNGLSVLNSLNDSVVNTHVGSDWNYFDSLGGIVLGVRQIQQGEIGMGVANLMGSAQLTACTMSANIAKDLSAATVSGLMGFSFAACMALSYCIEKWEVHKCNKRIKVLEEKLVKLAPSFDSEQVSQQRQMLQKSILIEKAQRENHERNATSWLGCAVAMTAVAIIGYAVASGLTFGALPAATLITAAAAFVSGLVRKWWVGRVDHVENVKKGLKKSDRRIPVPPSVSLAPIGAPAPVPARIKMKTVTQSLFDRLQVIFRDKELGIKFEDKVTVSGVGLFSCRIRISFHDYLMDMMIKDPKKLERIVNALEEKRADKRHIGLYDALHKQRDFSSKVPTGIKIYTQLTSPRLALR